MRKVILAIILIAVVLFSVLVIKTATFTSKQVAVEPMPDFKIDTQRAAQNLSRAIQLKTISAQEKSGLHAGEFLAFHQFLQEAFPRIHQQLQREVVKDFSLLYTWKGGDENLKPIVFMAHFDVVPVASETEGDWTHPPFAGQIADHFIWGRGSLDDKGSLIAMMEAVEALLAENYKARRTIYLAFGHDEEIGGAEGAGKIAELLKSKNVHAEWIIDESGIIATGIVPGVAQPVALVGIAEKGYLTLELTVVQKGGHSAMPPPETAIGILSSAIYHLQNNPFPAKLDGPTMLLFDYVGPEMSPGMRLLFANRWLFGPLIKNQLERSNSTNAGIRTTIAPTIIHGGTKENVLPGKAQAMINFRLAPGDSIEGVIAHVKKSINDPRVHIGASSHDANEASVVSDVHSNSFEVLQRTIRQVCPDSIVAPFLVVAATDTKHYTEISNNIYRFIPVRLTLQDLERIHGTNERIGVANFEEMIRFYVQIVRNANEIQG